MKCSVVNKMVEDHVDNLLSKNLVEIKVDRSPWGEDKIVVFRRKLENLLLAIAVNGSMSECNSIINAYTKYRQLG